MLEALITSKTRINLLLKFFLNSNNKAWLRSLETEFGESTNAIRLELNRLMKAGLLRAVQEGNKKVYMANTEHPLYRDIHNLLLKHIGLDKIIDKVTSRLGKVSAVYLVGELAKGKNSKVIDLWFVGDAMDKGYLLNLIEKSENMIHRKIRYIILSENELKDFMTGKGKDELLLVWKS
ncbi:MAG: ArsR family transcriptional regulator [bacterium]